MTIKRSMIRKMLSIVLALMLVVSTVCALSVNAADVSDELASEGSPVYYLYEQEADDLVSYVGQFESSKNGYSYELKASDLQNGEFDFIISTDDSTSSEVSQAVTKAADDSVVYDNSYFTLVCDNDVVITFEDAQSGVKCVENTVDTSAATEAEDDFIASTGAMTIYCLNNAGWSSVNAYVWNTSTDAYKSWPGEKMTDIGGDVWQINLPNDYKNIIFSNAGGNQTSDLACPGSGYIFDNKAGTWDIYDVSPLQVKSFQTDLPSPQYSDMDIVVSASATGEGEVSYKFSATNTSTGVTKVISDYSTTSSVKWTPTAVGTYTLKCEFKDSKGNTNERVLDYSIESDAELVEPIIKSVTPGDTYVQKNVQCNISVLAGGGKTGTNLLFYKYTITNANDKTVNVPYYTQKNTYSFTPTELGTYTLTVSVQSSDNVTVAKSYTLNCVNDIPTTGLSVDTLKTTGSLTVGNTIDVTALAKGGKSPYKYEFSYDGVVKQASSSKTTCSITLDTKGQHTIKVVATDAEGTTAEKSMTIDVTTKKIPDTRTLKGDANKDGIISVIDSTITQQFTAHLISDAKINQANADVDDSDSVTVIDATYIQQYISGRRPAIW